MAIAAALMMSTTITAQDNTSERKRDMKRPDKTEMVKKRTDETVKQYGLDSEQAAKLLELNTQYADKMGPRLGQRPGGMRGGKGQRPDSLKKQRPQRHEGEMKEGRPEGNDGPGMKERREQWMKQMEAYNAELQKIMTPEQFKAYKADREKRMKEGQRGRFRR